MGTRSSSQSGLRLAQQHLSAGEYAAAQAVVQQLRPEASEVTGGLSSVEFWATLGVAAAATGRYVSAAEHFQRAVQAAERMGDPALETAMRRFLERAEELFKQSVGESEFIHRPPMFSHEQPEPALPPSWQDWAGAMPRVAEYLGAVEVRWAGPPGDQHGRGLFATAAIKAGEALLIAWPIAQAKDSGGALEAAVMHACSCSARASRHLSCLADGSQGQVHPSLEFVNRALKPVPDELPSEEEREEAELDLRGIIRTNVFSIDTCGFAALYGLPSFLNHTCTGSGQMLKLIMTTGAIVFRASRDLAEGEELCHRYFDCSGPLCTRRDNSAKWGFACACQRCIFEAHTLPGTHVATVVDVALAAWRENFRLQMRNLAAALCPSTAPNNVSAEGRLDGSVLQSRTEIITVKHSSTLQLCKLLHELLEATGAVEVAARSQSMFHDEEVAWCLSLVQPLSNAALWCLLQCTSDILITGVESMEEQRYTEVRCMVLQRICRAIEHTEFFGVDHLQNLHLHWMAREELRMQAVSNSRSASNSFLLMAEAAEVQARSLCEQAFRARFGIEAHDLQLGAPGSLASRLLRRIRG